MNRRTLLASLGLVPVVGCARQSPLASAEASQPAQSQPVQSQTSTSLASETGVPASGTTSAGVPSASGSELSVAPSAPGPNISSWDLTKVVGQLFMAGLWEAQPSASWRSMATNAKLGSVILMSTRSRANATAATATLRKVVGSQLLVAVDQEGGKVQRMSGAGFTRIPSAQQQGRMSAQQLQRSWAGWAGELASAGVLMDLAPVADVVPTSMVSRNAPVGQLQRNYGNTPQAVGASVAAVVGGMRQARVASALKHFPGLGRVTTNTDFGDAQDTVTTINDPLLSSFASGIAAGASAVMMSSAVYTRIDPTQPAAFSPKVIGTMLRTNLKFDGVVISDDIGAAKAMAKFSPGARAVRFLDAGGDIVLTVNSALVPAMVAAVISKAKTDPTFEAALRTKAARVLKLKASVGIAVPN